MTDKVRIDNSGATTLNANNETYLARQAEFESNVRSYPRKLPFAIAKAQGVWITDVENNQYLDCLAGAGSTIGVASGGSLIFLALGAADSIFLEGVASRSRI